MYKFDKLNKVRGIPTLCFFTESGIQKPQSLVWADIIYGPLTVFLGPSPVINFFKNYIQLVKKSPALYGTRRFIIVFTTVRHWYLS